MHQKIHKTALLKPSEVKTHFQIFLRGSTESGVCGAGEEAAQETFPEFSARVLEEVAALGGEVFPKLNWSAPKVGGGWWW